MRFLQAIQSFFLVRVTSFSRWYILEILTKLSYGRLNVITKDQPQSDVLVFGASVKADPDAPEAEIIVKNKNVWTRLCLNLDLGFAEAYMLGELECDDLVSLVSIYIGNWTTLGSGSLFLQLLPRLHRLLFKPTNDTRHALQNASSHYDTSNALFAAFLSKDMSYSCPIWSSPEESLEEAQRRKVHNIIQKAQIQKEHHVLDIGGGWGYLAIEAVKMTGCRVTATTLSVEQKALGEKRIQEAGLQDRIQVLLCDYRNTPRIEGGYDRIVSVEMLEHVGKEFMDGYFGAIDTLLNREYGVVVVQGITIINKLHDNRANLDNFIDRYIFPGGYLPSISRLVDAVDKGSKGTLELESVQSIGPHYAKALRLWREKFLGNWEAIRADYLKERGEMSEVDIEAFRRRWIYYFSYCEAGFRAAILGDHVVTARRRPCVEETEGVPL